MASNFVPELQATQEPALNHNPAAALEQTKALLRAKDDTSRFVGLALLKSVLDNQPDLRNDSARIAALWEAISAKFLDRLLRASRNKKVTRQEAKDMTDIAVSVFHTFAILLSEESRHEKRFIARAPALMSALVSSSPKSTTLILQSLLTISSLEEGGLEVSNSDELSTLIEIAPQQLLVLDILSVAILTTASLSSPPASLGDTLDNVVLSLVVSFRGTDCVTLLAFIAGLLPKLPAEAISHGNNWLEPLIKALRDLVASRPTSVGRTAYTEAAAALLQTYPAKVPGLLFGDATSASKDTKPFSYLLVNLLLIDIRSSFPSLLVKLNSSDYPLISRRLSGAFDVISSFIGYLVQSLESEHLFMPPDLLLKLRKDIAETISLTIEYLRDRWDASIAGVAGLHPEARSGTSATSAGTRLTLTWDSMKGDISSDPLILASLRMLAIWLREDENENLRNESAGLMDMLVELYSQSARAQLDFRLAILLLLEGIMITEDGVDAFLAQGGWEALSDDLLMVARNGSNEDTPRGIEIVRVLLAVIDSGSITEPREQWMHLTSATTSIKPTSSHDSGVVELQIALLQLAVALLDLASLGMQKRHFTRIGGLSGIANQLLTHVHHSFLGPTASEFEESLQDVIMTLENLR